MVLGCGRAEARCALCCKGIRQYRLSVPVYGIPVFGNTLREVFFCWERTARKSALCSSLPDVNRAGNVPASQFKAAEAFGTVIPKPVCSHKRISVPGKFNGGVYAHGSY